MPRPILATYAPLVERSIARLMVTESKASRRARVAIPELLLLAACCCRLAYSSPVAGRELAGDWSTLRARDESLLVCRRVKGRLAAGAQPVPGGTIPRSEPLIISDRSRIFFHHIARSGGSSFATLLPRLVGSVLPTVSVSSPELNYAESLAATKALLKDMGPKRLRVLKFSNPPKISKHSKRPAALDPVPPWPKGANIVTREVVHVPKHLRLEWLAKGRPLLLSMYEEMRKSVEGPVAQVAFLRRPDERAGSRFHHDAVRGRHRCFQNPEQVMMHCLYLHGYRNTTCHADCHEWMYLAYSNTASKLLPASHLPNLQVLGITEHYDISICLFLYTFRLQTLFDEECLSTGLKARMATVVNSADQQSGLDSLRRKYEKKYKSKTNPHLCGPACRAANEEDYELWTTAVEIFWWRVHEMADNLGVDVECS